MNKKIAALFTSLAMFAAAVPCAFADTFVNEAFVGTYLSAGATEQNYGMLNIYECDNDSLKLDFKFVKNGNQQLIYSFSEGVMNNTKGTVRFTVSYADGTFVSNGTMDITLEDWCVKISCDSDQGQHLFDGTMKPQFNLDPYSAPTGQQSSTNTTQNNIIMNPGISVILNSQTVSFPNGVNPIMVNDSTYVPLRYLFDSLGINVYWDQYKKNDILNAQMITCTKNDTIIQFMRTYNDTGTNVWTLTKWVGENTDSKNFTRINITDLQPVIIDQYSYIPLRVVSESFGADVGWHGDTRVVEINGDVSNTYKYDRDLIGKIEDYSLDIATSYITDDYTNVTADTTPYFSPQAKFYKYSSRDQWNNVTLNVIYGGYIDVFPVTDTESQINEITENITEDISANENVTDTETKSVSETSENI